MSAQRFAGRLVACLLAWCLAAPGVSRALDELPSRVDDALRAASEQRVLDAAVSLFAPGPAPLDEGAIEPARLAQLKIAFISNPDAVRAGLAAADAGTRVAAIRALVFFDDRASSPQIAAALSDDDASVREAAALALGAMAAFDHEEALGAAARDDEAAVRAAAIGSLRRMACGEAVALAALADESAAVRAEAARLLADVPPADGAVAEAAEGLLTHTLRDASPAVRAASAAALGRLARRSAVPALVPAARDPDAAVALAAADALGDLGGDDAAAALVELARADLPVARRAVAAVGRAGVHTPAVVDGLAAVVRGAPLPVARAAAAALADIGGARAGDALVEAVTSCRRELTGAVAVAAARLGRFEPASILLRRLADPDPWAGIFAARALADLGNTAGFPAIIRSLDADDARLRAYAAACLALYTGVNNDFVGEPDAQGRARVADTWRRWWLDNRESFVIPRDGTLEAR